MDETPAASEHPPVTEIEKVLALDPATQCGWAHTSGLSGTWDLSVRRDESTGMRLVRFHAKLREMVGLGVDLIVFEAARNAAPQMQGALTVQAELQGVLKHFCEERQINYRGFSPSEIKRHALGKGSGSKEEMIHAARARWGSQVKDDNQADALWLLDLAHSLYRD